MVNKRITKKVFKELLSPQIQGCLNTGFTVKFGLQINTECLMHNMGICIFIRRQLTVSRKKKDIWMWSFLYPGFKTQLDCRLLREALMLLFLPFPSLSSPSPAPLSQMMAILTGQHCELPGLQLTRGWVWANHWSFPCCPSCIYLPLNLGKG